MNDHENELPIREFSKIVGIRQSVLRYYDEIGLFKPSGRGENNYRAYTLEQIQIIKLIETLRRLKVPLKEIRSLLAGRDSEQMLHLLSHQERYLNRELKELQESFALIHTLRFMMQSEMPQDEKLIELQVRDSMQIDLGPVNEFREGEGYHRVYAEYYRLVSGLKLNISYPIGGYFDTFEEFLATPSRPKRFFLLNPEGKDETVSGRYLVAYHRGNYGEMGNLPARIENFAQEQNIALMGPVYQLYPISELYTREPDDYLLRTSILVSR